MFLANMLMGVETVGRDLTVVGVAAATSPERATAITISLPVGSAAGDFCLMSIVQDSNLAGSTSVASITSGFSVLQAFTTWGAPVGGYASYTKVLDATDISNGTVFVTLNDYNTYKAAGIIVVNGAITAVVSGTSNDGGTETTTLSVPSATTTTGRVYLAAACSGQAQTIASAVPATYIDGSVTQKAKQVSGSSDSYTQLELVYFTEDAGATVSGESWTYPSVGDWACNVYEIY
jgi:hypothetical protein